MPGVISTLISTGGATRKEKYVWTLARSRAHGSKNWLGVRVTTLFCDVSRAHAQWQASELELESAFRRHTAIRRLESVRDL